MVKRRTGFYNFKGDKEKMTDKEKQELYENICNDINCGTFILAPQYVGELLAKYTKVYRKKLRRIKKLLGKID